MDDIVIDFEPENNTSAPVHSIDIEKSASSSESPEIVLDPLAEDIQVITGEDVKVKDTSKSQQFKPKEFKSINQLMSEGYSKEDAIAAVNERRHATTVGQFNELGRQFSLGASKTALGLAKLATTPYSYLTGDNVEAVDNLSKKVQEEESYFKDRLGVNIPDVVNKAMFAAPAIANAPAMMAGSTLKASGVLGTLLNSPATVAGAAFRGAATGGAYEYSNYKTDSDALKTAALNATIGAGVVLAPHLVGGVSKILQGTANMLSHTKGDMQKQAIYDLKQFANISDEQAENIVKGYSKFVDTSNMYKEEKHLLSLLHQQDISTLYKVISTDKEAASVVRRFLEDQKDAFKARMEVPDNTVGADSIKYFKGYIATTDKILEGMHTQLKAIPTTSFRWNVDSIIKGKELNTILGKMEFTPIIDKLVKNTNKLATSFDEQLSAADLFSFRNTLEKFRLDNIDRMTSTETQAFKAIATATNKEISRMAKSSLEDPDKFVSAWRSALIGKRETLELTKNKLYKDITTAGLSEDQIIEKYFKYVNSADKTFVDVVNKLPVDGVKKIESTMINKSLEMHSRKEFVDFVQLDKTLSHLPFRTAEAKERQLLIAEASKIFRNNPELKMAADKVQLEGDKSGILTNASGIIISKLNNFLAKYIYSYVPSQEGRKLNAFRRLDAVVSRPADIKAVRELKATIPESEHKEMEELIAQLRQHQANRKYLLNLSKGK